jgi:hypothetical protein
MPNGNGVYIASYAEKFENDDFIYYYVSDEDIELPEFELTKLVCQQTDVEFKEFKVECTIDFASVTITRRVIADSEETALATAWQFDLDDVELHRALKDVEIEAVIPTEATEVQECN